MSALSKFKQGIKEAEGFNPLASFNAPNVPKVKVLKKLSALGPIQGETKVLEVRPASPRKLITGLPRVEFPYIRTLIEPNSPEIVFLNKLSPTKKFETPRRIDIAPVFVVDNDRRVLIVGEGINRREYELSSINSSSSKTQKSISKSEAQELANTYLKLKIPPQQKKDVFIRAIREKINLSEE